MVEDDEARIAREAAIVTRLDPEMAKDVARERKLAGSGWGRPPHNNHAGRGKAPREGAIHA
jgi:hypothetical protein